MLATIVGLTKAVEAAHLAMLLKVFALSRISHLMIMLAGPLIGIDLRIVSWMVGWLVIAYLAVLVMMLPGLSEYLAATASTVAATGALIVGASFMPWNRAK